MLNYYVVVSIIVSYLYKTVRFILKKICFSYQTVLKKPRNLEPVITIGHSIVSKIIQYNVPIYPKTSQRHSLAVEVFDLKFPNPITFAAYESHIPLLTLFLKLGIGGGCYKTMMTEPRAGNKQPRIQEVVFQDKTSLINAMGLPGKGAQYAIDQIKKSNLLHYKRPLGLSLGGESIQGYLDTFKIYESSTTQLTHPFYYELNISCPNTDEGQHLASNIQALADLVMQLRSKTDKTISIKVSPDQTTAQLQDIAKLASENKNIMITAGNTQYKSCQDVGLPSHAISRGGGGLSGPALFKRTCELIDILKPFNIPIIATGGIQSIHEVNECLSRGANITGMATALALDPYCIPRIINGLK